MATGGEAKGEGEAGEGGREGGGEGVQAMERDNALSHDRIVPLPPLTLEVTISNLVGNSVFGFRFLGRPEFGIPLPSSEFRNFPAENQIGKPENRSSQKSEFRFRFFRNSGIPLITYIGTQYIPILYYNLRK